MEVFGFRSEGLGRRGLGGSDVEGLHGTIKGRGVGGAPSPQGTSSAARVVPAVPSILRMTRTPGVETSWEVRGDDLGRRAWVPRTHRQRGQREGHE